MILNLAIDEHVDRGALFGIGRTGIWCVLRELLGVHVSARDNVVRVSGEAAAVSRAAAVIGEMQQHLRRHHGLDKEQLPDVMIRARR